MTVLQFREQLSDRQAAEAVRARIDWKYLLSLELSDEGFDFSVLSEFRARLVRGGAEELLLEKLLAWSPVAGLVKARGKQRTDSTHVVAAVCVLNRLELVGETLRAALNELARLAHVSLSTLKRALKKLTHHSLVPVEWQIKRASFFTVHGRPLAPSSTIDLRLSPKLYDFFSEEDRALFLSCKRSLSPQDQRALEQEANGHSLVADVLLFRRTFGPDRQRHYDTVIAHLTRNGRPN